MARGETNGPSVFLGKCKRCFGDMYSNRDMYGAYQQCLQCGHMVDEEQPKRYAGMLGRPGAELAGPQGEQREVA